MELDKIKAPLESLEFITLYGHVNYKPHIEPALLLDTRDYTGGYTFQPALQLPPGSIK